MSGKKNIRFISGLAIFLFINASFIFLLASPYIENPFGEEKK